MDPKFAALVETLAPKLERLLAAPPLAYGALPRDMPKSGVYLFTEAGGTCTSAAQTACVIATAAIAAQGRPTGRRHLRFC